DGDCAFNLLEDICGVSGSAGTTMFGWTVGAGLDYKWQIDQNSAVILGFEYLHYQFGEHSLAFGPLQQTGTGRPNIFPEFGAAYTFTIGYATQTIRVIKGRISYFFSIH